MNLTEEQRQALGEALTNKLAAMCPESDLSRGPVAPDWFDSRNVDEVLDVIEQTLAAGVGVDRHQAVSPADADASGSSTKD